VSRKTLKLLQYLSISGFIAKLTYPVKLIILATSFGVLSLSTSFLNKINLSSSANYKNSKINFLPLISGDFKISFINYSKYNFLFLMVLSSVDFLF